MFKLIVLHDPDDKEPPSAQTSLAHFIKVGKRLKTEILLRTMKDIDLTEGDALFIRQTTMIGNGTYFIAKAAENLGIPVLDDSASIRICTDKVETYYRFKEAKVPQPETVIIRNGDIRIGFLSFPIVIKQPDSCFSRGVFKVDSLKELKEHPIINDRELVIQEYLPTAFDWRIGVLNNKVLYCAKYFMPKGHWQIVKRYPSGHHHLGGHEILKLHDWPTDVCRLALQAAACVGNGLYGVDIKETKKGLVVIEINDNPSIDSDAEGKYGVWERIIERFKEMAHGRKSGHRKSINSRPDDLGGNSFHPG